MKEDLKCLGILLGIGLLVVFLIFSLLWIVYPKVEVFVNNECVYKGSDLCVDVSSSGFNTTVKISRFFCLIPSKSYTSRNITINTVEQ